MVAVALELREGDFQFGKILRMSDYSFLPLVMDIVGRIRNKVS